MLDKRRKYISKMVNNDATISRRSLLLTIGKTGIFAIIGSRLAYLQLYKNSDYRSLSDENRITHRLIEPLRGIIYDVNGTTLANNIESYQASVILEETPNIKAALVSLNKVLPEKKIDVDQTIIEINRSKRFVPVKILDNLTWSEFSRLNANLYRLKGIFPSVSFKRNYPKKDSHAHLVGYVSDISNKESFNNPFYKLNNSKSGKIGIEKSFDKQLRGNLGNKSLEINAFGREIRELTRIDGKEGRNIQLTIDSDVQEFCYNQLSNVSGSISVIDITNGNYIALASSPAFDPNQFSSGLSQEYWNELIDNEYKPLINKTISSYYPPGSTIKPLVALAGLESGINHLETFNCTGKHEVADTSLDSGYKYFHCWKKNGHGNLDMTGAIRESCDVYFYQLARKIGINKISEVCKRFGLGQDVFDIFFEEKEGIVPDKKWKMKTLGKRWLIGETLVAAIGQSYFLSTSSQLSLATAQIVNGGKKLETSIFYKKNKNKPKLPILLAAQSHLKIISNAMDEATNNPKGTSYRSRISGEHKMGGKTGTSQVRAISAKEREEGIIKNKDLPWNRRDHGLFIGFGPLKNPRYAISVIVEHGGSGSASAAPIASKVLEFMFLKKLNLKRKMLNNV